MQRQYFFLLYGYVILAAAIGGCRRQLIPDDLPKLYPVKIEILQDGKPLEGARITLIPLLEQGKWTSGGRTDATGVTTLQTHGKYAGVPTGQYKVCVSKEWNEKGSPDGMSENHSSDKSYTLVEKKYLSASTTPLEIEVTTQKNIVSYDIGKSVKILLMGP